MELSTDDVTILFINALRRAEAASFGRDAQSYAAATEQLARASELLQTLMAKVPPDAG